MLQENSSINLEEEFDKSIKQRLAEQFENLTRIPFISSGKIFKRFFDLEPGHTPAGRANSEIGFDEATFNGSENPFNRERRLTESVPPKNTRMTL